jgi:Beta propeller domain
MAMTLGTALRRIVATLTVLLAVTTAFAAGFLVSDARHDPKPQLHLTAAGLDSGLSCDRLREWYVDHGLDRVTAWGWQGPALRAYAVPQAGMAEDSAGSPTSPSLDTATGSGTGTNVQETGVDEPDLAKVSGGLLVRISGSSLKTDDVSGSEPRRLGVAPLDRIGDPQLLLAGDRAVVIGSEVEDPAAGAPLVAPPPRTWVRTYDLSDPSHPTLVDSRVYDGSLVTVRQVGSTVRLVLDGGLPALDFETPSSSVSQQEALAHNRAVVRDSTVTDWLPQVTTYQSATQAPLGSPAPAGLVDCTDVAVPETYNGLGTLTVVGFDPATPDDADATAVATSSAMAYMSPTHLYVATSPWQQAWPPNGGPIVMPMDAPGPTRIYGFDLSGTAAQYVGMGSVDGTVAGSWSMDEHDGVLRVAVSSDTGTTGTSIVLLRPESGRLMDIGHLGGLGVRQELKSVRWFDDLAVLVTFQQTDPFYVVDLADAAHPRVLGALHLPGWSSYLHPVGPHLVLGLGQTSPQMVMVDPPQPLPTKPQVPVPPNPAPEGPDAPNATASTVDPQPVDPQPMIPLQGAKATLFDISDPAHPRALGTVDYPAGSVAQAATNPHQVTWLPDRDTLLTVISGTYGQARAWISVLTIRDGTLHDRRIAVPGAADVNDVRTLPLADGRVVLVAGDSVEFLPL